MRHIHFFPTPYPDELLYSIIARYTEQASYPSVQHAMAELYGEAYHHPSATFPNRIQQLLDRLPAGHVFTADSLIDEHTLLPLYSAFSTASQRETARERMRGSDGGGILFVLGQARSKTPALTVFRCCPTCVHADRETYGETYWHRQHHIPGITVCADHGTALLETHIPIHHQTQMIHADTVLEAGLS